MNPRQAIESQKDINKALYLPKKTELAVNLIHAFIKNNNILGLKLAILLSGARSQITYDNENKVHFEVEELCKLLKTDRRNLSRNLKKICSTQYTYVTLEGQAGMTTPIHSYEYYAKSTKIWFEISSKGKELFSELGKGGYQFTKCISENLMELKHKHSLRMQLFLELVNNYSANVGKRIKMSKDDVNDYFGTNYANWYEIERKILEPVRSEINTASSLTFRYDFTIVKNQGTGRPKFDEIIIDVVDNSESLFALAHIE
ncbi:replication initiation protein [Flexistipes sinusarabici]|uniref:replication initiation protein n=1 Tax=Flexistipes sinusarabici TaxID=2352 RepID=UPI0023546046|nr:replication initiation protein [Flexistipes sinusarabici]